jgi:hypothetical protein
VREALVWLGEADPVDTMERVRAVDTAIMKRRQLMKAWPFATETSVAAVIVRAQERLQTREVDPATGKDITVDLGLADPDLHAAVMAIAAGKDGQISGECLGWWLRRNKDHVVYIEGRGRCRFEQVGESRLGLTWLLVCLDEEPN